MHIIALLALRILISNFKDMIKSRMPQMPKKRLVWMAKSGMPQPDPNSSDPYEKYLAQTLKLLVRQDGEFKEQIRRIRPDWL
jgi:hypothetical protein